MTKLDWEINIENLAASVAENYGADVVEAVFSKHKATSVENLPQCAYEEVFSDLMLMESDADP